MLKKYPETITRLTERIAGYEQDLQLATAHRKPQEGFAGITILEQLYADKEAAGNVVIYGHHMKNGSMFSDLCKYESEDFYQAHKNVHFDTLADFGEYEIVAAFKTVAYSQEGFKYYHFVNAEDEAAFDEFIAECKSLALYDTGVSAEYGDKLITLSTCEYSRTNGRMVIVAKLVVPSAEEVDADAGH